LYESEVRMNIYKVKNGIH